MNPDEEEEKRRLIGQVLELQNTLDGEGLLFMLRLFLLLKQEGHNIWQNTQLQLPS